MAVLARHEGRYAEEPLRCTRQIMAFAEDWLDSESYVPDERLGVLEGEMPRVMLAASAEEAAENAAVRITEMRKQGMPQGRMAVLYAKFGVGLPRLLHKALSLQGHMWIWPVADAPAKRRYDITTDSVTISTIHSMKGMDFAHVTLVLPRSLAQGREKSLLKRLEERRSLWEKRRKVAKQDSGMRTRHRKDIPQNTGKARFHAGLFFYASPFLTMRNSPG